ncbi:hypothetical protein E4U57_004849 [Claviceps arundinis]|uniref:Uncharacterized protein n=1 Tax=Claviceps arundinis TaxID=1623583 RepID=A0ABQ7PKC8_9HYPO|nr:hypothetical protein E4U57_004849 [Claviceps arundinis]
MESVVDGSSQSRHQSENDRLNIQHAIIKSIMGGKLLMAPVNLERPNLRILDSGTAQANWLLDLAGLVPSTAQLTGTDIAPEQFPLPSQRPPNMTLQKQSIFDPWNEAMLGSFDVVHQRFVLAACQSDEHGRRAVANLLALTKPGGWIELHEGNMLAIQEGEAHSAMMRFRDIAVAAWVSIGQVPNPGPRLTDWMRDAGVVDMYEEVQTIGLGAAARNQQEAEWSTELCLNMLQTIKRMTAGKGADAPSEQEFDTLEVALRKELQENSEKSEERPEERPEEREGGGTINADQTVDAVATIGSRAGATVIVVRRRDVVQYERIVRFRTCGRVEASVRLSARDK